MAGTPSEHATNEFALAEHLRNFGRYEKAEQYYRSALAEVQVWSGDDEGATLPYRIELAALLCFEGKFSEARKLLQQSMAIISASPTPDTLEESHALFYLGFAELEQGNLSAAEDNFKSVLALADRHQAVAEGDLEYCQLALADVYSKRGNAARAESIIRHVLNTTQMKESYIVVAGHSLLGHVLLAAGQARRS